MNGQTAPVVAPAASAIITTADRSAIAAERQLLAAVERAARHPHGRLAIVLHLSALHAPAPRPHHLRIARALMHDVAQRHEGQTFALRNGDVALLCQTARPEPGSAQAALAALPATLGRMFRHDIADAATLVSVWPLATATERMLAYVTARLAGGDARAAAGDAAAPAADMVDALDALIAETRPFDLIQRQTAALLGGPADRGRSDQMRPIYQELGFSMDLLEARLRVPGRIVDDPYLMRHVAVRLDLRLLQSLDAESGSGGPLDPVGSRLPLHVNLTLPGLLSTEFASLALACHNAGRSLAAEVSLIDAAADPARYAAARDRAGKLGVCLVLDGLSHLALVLACPWHLRPDLLKLDWSPRLPDLPPPEQAALGDVLREIGPARMILHRADSEAAIRWGLANGIRRFQGRHIDAMLAASRIMGCPLAAPCNLRQCVERASATGGAARASCRNHPLLDAGAAAGPTPTAST